MAENRTDRRSGAERRTTSTENELESRRRERRMGDRRDSPRLALGLMVRHPELGGSFEERDGDLSVGGAYFEQPFRPTGSVVQLRFRLPRIEREVRCEAEIVRLSEKPASEGGGFGIHVRFGELSADVELAIARWVDEHAKAP